MSDLEDVFKRESDEAIALVGLALTIAELRAEVERLDAALTLESGERERTWTRMKDRTVELEAARANLAALLERNAQLESALGRIQTILIKGNRGVDHWEDCDASACETDECGCPPEVGGDEASRAHDASLCSCTLGTMDDAAELARAALVKP